MAEYVDREDDVLCYYHTAEAARRARDRAGRSPRPASFARQEDIMILFRPVCDPLPPDWSPGLHWQVEYHDDASDCSRPLGIAWVTAAEGLDYLDYVLVCDDCRRRGIATALIAACRERWPGIRLTDSISEAGESLLASLDESAALAAEHARAKREADAERRANDGMFARADERTARRYGL